MQPSEDRDESRGARARRRWRGKDIARGKWGRRIREGVANAEWEVQGSTWGG